MSTITDRWQVVVRTLQGQPPPPPPALPGRVHKAPVRPAPRAQVWDPSPACLPGWLAPRP
ncbi:MAG: hypothetical protein Q8M01_14045 [Rubrivivax sp.]|nr:hypothetical protein [Rubrivivax sp.]